MNINLPETLRRAAKIKTFILGSSYNSFQNVIRVFKIFYVIRIASQTRIQVCLTKQWLISDIYFGIWQVRIAERLQALEMRLVNVDIGRDRGFEPKIVQHYVLKYVNINKVCKVCLSFFCFARVKSGMLQFIIQDIIRYYLFFNIYRLWF